MMKPIRFGLIGEYQSGKSLLANCLLQRSIATVGKGTATTHTVVNYQYGEDEYVKFTTTEHKSCILPINEFSRLDTSTNILVANVYIKNEFLKNFILTDIPGFGANDTDNELARDVLSNIDYAILIASSDKSFGNNTDSFRSLRVLKEYRIPYYFFLNCTKIDRWRCDDEGNIDIANQDMNMLSFYPPSTYPLSENGLNIVNLMWYWYSISNEDDELINRRVNKLALYEYCIEPPIKAQLQEASNFNLIKELFDMEHREYLELKRSIREEIDALKRELCPIGTIQAFAFNRIPEGWMLCDGRILNVNKYQELYRTIGNAFGGDGKTQFAIPDLRGRFIRGWCGEGTIDSNRVFGTTQEDAIQGHYHKIKYPEKVTTTAEGSHKHGVYYNSHKAVTSVGGLGSTADDYSFWEVYGDSLGDRARTNTAGTHYHSVNLPEIEVCNPMTEPNFTDVRVDKETRPKNIALLFCIKAI